MTASIQIKGAASAQALMQKLPEEIQLRTIKRALKNAADIVIKAAKVNVPSGAWSGSRYRQSRKQQQESPRPLFDTITSRSVSYKDGVDLVVVGPAYPDGAHGHLVERGHVKVLWGNLPKGSSSTVLHTPRKQRHQRGMAFVKKTVYGEGSARVEGKEFLAPAADSTQSQQEKAIIDTIVRAIKRVEKETLKAR